MDSCFKKTILDSKLHPTEAAFLCWMNNGVWSIPYPKIWWITQRWIQMTFLVLMRLRDLRKFWQAPGLLSYEVFHLCRAESHQLLSWDLLKLLSGLFQAGQDEWNCSAAAFTQSQHSYFTVADICYRQTQQIQRGRQRCRNIQQERCWQGLVSTFFPQNTRSIHSVKEDCWTKFLPDHEYKKIKDRFLPRNTSSYL